MFFFVSVFSLFPQRACSISLVVLFFWLESSCYGWGKRVQFFALSPPSVIREEGERSTNPNEYKRGEVREEKVELRPFLIL